MSRENRRVLPRVRGRDLPDMRPRIEQTRGTQGMETSEQAGTEVQQARMLLHDMNFHDDAIAVIATLNRVSVWKDAGTAGRVVTIHTKYADTRYL